MLRTHLRRGRGAPLLAAAAAAALLLAGCTSASPTSGATAGVSASEAPASERCSLTPDVDPDATMQISGLQFGDEITVAAGDAVAFANQDSVAHNVVEGTGGVPAADACINEPIAPGSTLVVTFTEPGDYQITCTIHPPMQTVIHVE
jgi:plastocyanin